MLCTGVCAIMYTHATQYPLHTPPLRTHIQITVYMFSVVTWCLFYHNVWNRLHFPTEAFVEQLSTMDVLTEVIFSTMPDNCYVIQYYIKLGASVGRHCVSIIYLWAGISSKCPSSSKILVHILFLELLASVSHGWVVQVNLPSYSLLCQQAVLLWVLVWWESQLL